MDTTALDELAKALAKEGVTSDASEIRDFIDTGIPHLNYILSGCPFGGIATGRMVEIAGESMSGKTMLLSQIFIAAQKADGYAGIWDHERSYMEALSVKQGLSLHPGKWVKKTGISFEDSCVQAHKQGKIIREVGMTGPIVVGFDSFAAMIPLSQLETKGPTGKVTEKDMDAYTMNDTTALARVASTVLKVFKAKISDYGITAIFLNQLAASMDTTGGPMSGPQTKSKGGKSLPFYCDIRLLIGGKEIKDAKGKLIGKKMTIQVKKNKITMPGDKIEIDFMFDRVTRVGYFDILPSYIEFLKKEGVIETNGAWIIWGGEKFQGTQKLIDHYTAMPDGLEQLKILHKDWLDARAKA